MQIILYIWAIWRTINCIVQVTWFYLYVKDKNEKNKH
jgi:hypothetical protein